MQDRSSTTRIHELAAQARTQEVYLPLGGTDPDFCLPAYRRAREAEAEKNRGNRWVKGLPFFRKPAAGS
ncbi:MULTISPECIES: hypothetical protein [Arthrobacter]|uniref:Uncharacterized protein n=2 Tax=Arthrobacter TaxID=1663 RepID=A0ABU9KL69_9MICC|nr:hypothetical protein [Arthrobacter sp. YJM1]MDP5227645.1 hypothetical protein [Arthrobacter sp. YJM1]